MKLEWHILHSVGGIQLSKVSLLIESREKIFTLKNFSNILLELEIPFFIFIKIFKLFSSYIVHTIFIPVTLRGYTLLLYAQKLLLTS